MAKRKIKATTVKPTQQKEKKQSGLWANIKFLFGTLFSNDRCIDGATKKPWYTAVIVALVACIIAVVPTMVSYFTRSGASFFSGNNYSLDNSLTEFSKTLNDSDVSMKIGDGKLTVDEAAWKSICKDNEGGEIDHYNHYYTVKEVKLVSEGGKPEAKEVTYCDLAVYYVSNAKLAGSPIYDYANTILAKNDPNAGLNTTETTWSTNLIIFGEESFIAFKKPNIEANKTYETAVQGKYDFADKFDLKNLFKEDMKGKAYEHAYGTAAHRNDVLESYKGFFAASFESTKNAVAWQYTGIAFAIDAGLVFLYGLLIFLMTRGKRNPWHTLNFGQTQLISCWEALAPALLSLLGFIPLFPTRLSMFLFLFLMGMRTMWMSTRQLRPVYDQE